MRVRYSDYSIEQLRTELGKMKEKLQKAEQFGEVNEVEIYERKMQMLASYMENPEDFKAHAIYGLRGDPGHQFKINFIEGVMAWGHRVNILGEVYQAEEALPIALLDKEIKK